MVRAASRITETNNPICKPDIARRWARLVRRRSFTKLGASPERSLVIMAAANPATG